MESLLLVFGVAIMIQLLSFIRYIIMVIINGIRTGSFKRYSYSEMYIDSSSDEDSINNKSVRKYRRDTKSDRVIRKYRRDVRKDKSSSKYRRLV